MAVEVDDIVVTDEALPYLVAQRGRLDGLKDRRAAWEAAYRESLEQDLAELAPFTPRRCRRILDVGGGMGGIDVLLARRRYAGQDVAVTILDGDRCAPQVVAHDAPFSDWIVAKRFLAANGVDATFVTPELAMTPDLCCEAVEGELAFDLIVSLQAWCFHFAPETYLDFVLRHSARDATVIVDLRADRPEWARTLAARLDEVGEVRRAGAKFIRRAYVRK